MIYTKSILLLFISSFFSCKAQNNILKKSSNETKEFILIANVGSSNYSVAPLIISRDSINYIPHKKTYDLNVRFNGFRNIIISDSEYKKLFSYLNIYNGCENRPEKFIREERAILIIDYRNSSKTDCKLLTVKDISTVLFILKELYCYLKQSNFNEDVYSYIKGLYMFYIEAYNKEYYNASILCE